MKNIYFTLGLLWLVSLTTFAQVPPRWTAVFQGSGDNSDRFNKVIPDGAGNFIGVGYTIKKGNYRDILVVKFDTAGDTLWWRTKNGKGGGDDEAVAAGVDAIGNVYVAGTVDAGNSQDNIITLKFDAAGTPQWDTTWDNPAAMLDDQAVDLKMDGGGNCIVSGNTKPDTISGNRDIVVLNYAPNGGLQWSTIWTRTGITAGKDECAALAIDNNNQIYVTGRSFGSTDDFILLQLENATGVVNWQMPYNGGGEDRATAISIDASGYIIITGSSDNGSNLDYRINKYNNAGLLQWTRSLSAPAAGDEKPYAIVTDASDNIYVTGSADVASGATINLDFQTVKYNSSGTLQWARRDGSAFNQEDVGLDLSLDGNGNVYVTGKSDQNFSPTSADFDYMTVAYSPTGTPVWGPVYHAGTRGGSDDIPASVIFDNGIVYVGGGAVNITTHKDATVVKYDAAAGTVIWVKDFNGTGDFSDEAKAIVVDANNISYVSGSAFVENQNLNACIAKIDNAGTVLCTYQYNGLKNDDDEFKTIALSSNGAIYAAGYTKVTDQKRNMLLMKWNPSTCDTANVGWTRTYDFIGQSDRIEAMILDNAGNIYVTGRSDANPADTIDNNDILTIKYDSNGNVLWVSRYDDPNFHMRDEPTVMKFDNVGDIVIGGRTENNHDDDFIVLKLNPLDGLIRAGFPVRYNNGSFTNDDQVSDIAFDASNNIYVAGFSQTGSGNTTQDPTVLAYDANGVLLPPLFIYSSLDKDDIVKIAFDSFGDLYLLNKFADGSGPVVNYDYVLRKMDAGMNTIWMRNYDDPFHSNDEPVDMTLTPSGDVYITGTSVNDTLGSLNKNWVTLGYDSAGNQIFYANANGTNNSDDSPNAIIIRGTTVWVCGATEGSNNNQKDLTVISYDLPLNIGVSLVGRGNASIAYPNPFSDNCRIFVDPNGGDKYFELFDMLGNKVSEKLKINGEFLNFNKGNLSRGIYQYKIISATSIIGTGKLIIN